MILDFICPSSWVQDKWFCPFEDKWLCPGTKSVIGQHHLSPKGQNDSAWTIKNMTLHWAVKSSVQGLFLFLFFLNLRNISCFHNFLRLYGYTLSLWIYYLYRINDFALLGINVVALWHSENWKSCFWGNRWNWGNGTRASRGQIKEVLQGMRKENFKWLCCQQYHDLFLFSRTCERFNRTFLPESHHYSCPIGWQVVQGWQAAHDRSTCTGWRFERITEVASPREILSRPSHKKLRSSRR